jgi:N-acetylglucosaminyldiphosphoundecaprenol N-acetyl-beta-D-mannosaminyltransferase
MLFHNCSIDKGDERGRRMSRQQAKPAKSWRLQVGPLEVDAVTMEQALERIDELVASGAGGRVFTPNIDHVVMADRNPLFRRAYARVDLSLADGFPIVVTSKLLRKPLPAKVSGSDLVLPLLRQAQDRNRRVFLFGGAPGVAEICKARLTEQIPGLQIVGTASPMVSMAASDEELLRLTSAIGETRAEYVLVALGAPKQELLIDRIASAYAPAVFLGIGASLDFIAGHVRRAPRWMSENGLEWLHRVSQDPRRLAGRYLRDTVYPLIVAKHLWSRSRSSG